MITSICGGLTANLLAYQASSNNCSLRCASGVMHFPMCECPANGHAPHAMQFLSFVSLTIVALVLTGSTLLVSLGGLHLFGGIGLGGGRGACLSRPGKAPQPQPGPTNHASHAQEDDKSHRLLFAATTFKIEPHAHNTHTHEHALRSRAVTISDSDGLLGATPLENGRAFTARGLTLGQPELVKLAFSFGLGSRDRMTPNDPGAWSRAWWQGSEHCEWNKVGHFSVGLGWSGAWWLKGVSVINTWR